MAHESSTGALDKGHIPRKSTRVFLSHFCEWLATTQGSIALHESLYMYPVVESAHVLTLCVFIGLAAILDLRLLGLTLRRVPFSEVAARLLPFMAGGFLVMIVTGALLFYAIPVRSFHNVFFRAKMIMLALAGLNAWVFHRRVYRRVLEWDLDPIAPRAARVGGAVSLVLWAAIIVSGRMIAYNWFDCDKPQPAAIVFAASCDSYPK
jgi:hypothetical protein